jgi:hypothetical protein
MTIKNTPNVVPEPGQPPITAKASPPTPDPFDPANLRLSQSFVETAGVKKLLTTVPVRKPGSQDFVRVRPEPEYRENFPIIELKEEREEYIVVQGLVPALTGEFVTKTLFTTVNRQGTVFFWPVRLPLPDGKNLDWWRSGREAAELAMKSWIRVRANMNLGAYDIFEADGNNKIPDPQWPDLSFWDLIKIAFRDHLITSLDHPVIERLRGAK